MTTSRHRWSWQAFVRRSIRVIPAAGLPLVLLFNISPNFAAAQSLSDPFGEPETSRPPPKASPPREGSEKPFLAPIDEPGTSQTEYAPPLPGYEHPGSGAPPQTQAYETADPQQLVPPSIERIELAPLAVADDSGLPNELWNGLSAAEVEALLAKLDIPPKSAALHALWHRFIASSAAPPSGSSSLARVTAMRAEVLYRSGLIPEAAAIIASDSANANDPILTLMLARVSAANGDQQTACSTVTRLNTVVAELPPSLKGEAGLLGGFCAALAGDMASAELKANLARELAPQLAYTADALEAVASGGKPPAPLAATLTPLDYRILQFAQVPVPPEAITRASPALLTLLSQDSQLTVPQRLAATEAAAGLNAIKPDALAAAYRSGGVEQDGDGGRRAELFRAAEGERTPARKTRAIRAFLDSAKKDGLYWQALIMMHGPVQSIIATPEIGWFAETAVEVELASENYPGARTWAQFGSSLDRPVGAGGPDGSSLGHWLALADIAGPDLAATGGANLAQLDTLAANGRIPAPVLHRLVTVLDALEIQVPIPLWDKASRTPQPETGHLPETGVLSQLQEASKKKEFGRTVLLSMQALGRDGPESAHLIALGDTIRALRRANLETDARRLGFEALFGSWPRTAGT